jgi:hypothetical protein
MTTTNHSWFPNVSKDLASKSYLHINLLVIFLFRMMHLSFIGLNFIWGKKPHKKIHQPERHLLTDTISNFLIEASLFSLLAEPI